MRYSKHSQTLEITSWLQRENWRSTFPLKVYKFWQVEQQQEEGIDTFLMWLKQLSINWGFPDTDTEVKSQIIQGCSSSGMWRRALREDQTLEHLLKFAWAIKFSDKQVSEIEQAENTNVICSYKLILKKPGNNEKQFQIQWKEYWIEKAEMQNNAHIVKVLVLQKANCVMLVRKWNILLLFVVLSANLSIRLKKNNPAVKIENLMKNI